MSEKQLIHVTYGPLKMAPSEKTSAKRQSLRQRLFNLLADLRTVLVNLLVILILSLFISLAVIEFFRKTVIIDTVNSPNALLGKGFTDIVFAQHLLDEISTIQTNTTSNENDIRLLLSRGENDIVQDTIQLSTKSQQIDFVEPSTGISFQSLIRLVRNAANRSQTRISGEFTCLLENCKTKDLSFRLRVHTKEGFHYKDIKEVGEDQAAFITKVAVESMNILDPYSLAVYLKNVRSNEVLALQTAKELISSGHKDRAIAANLMGSIQIETGAFQRRD